MTWRAFLERRPWDGRENLRIIRGRQGDAFDLVQPFTFKSYPPFSAAPEDEVALRGNAFADGGGVRDFLQAMVNLAWENGIKPIQLEDQRNELKAVRDHLADMRMLAMKLDEPR